jgi:exodeoxyribonuclease VII small subunit
VSEPDGAAQKVPEDPKETLSYEQARDKLAAVVKRLEAGGLSLEQSLELWERGERLATVCEEWLDGARARLAAAMATRDGEGPGREGLGREGPGREGSDQEGRAGPDDDAPF